MWLAVPHCGDDDGGALWSAIRARRAGVPASGQQGEGAGGGSEVRGCAPEQDRVICTLLRSTTSADRRSARPLPRLPPKLGGATGVPSGTDAAFARRQIGFESRDLHRRCRSDGSCGKLHTCRTLIPHDSVRTNNAGTHSAAPTGSKARRVSTVERRATFRLITSILGARSTIECGRGPSRVGRPS